MVRRAVWRLMALNGRADTHQIRPVLKVDRPRRAVTLTGLITNVTRGRQGRNSNLLETGSGCGQTNSSVVIERAMRLSGAERLWNMFRLPDFSVVVWLRKTDGFAALKGELLGAAATEPYESTEYQGMVVFPLECRQPSRGQEPRRRAEGCRTTSGTRCVTDHEPGRWRGLSSRSKTSDA